MPALTDIYRLDNFIDTFALGHYARVLAAQDLRNGDAVAFKVMRPEHIDGQGDMLWEYQAFGNEAQIMARLAQSEHMVELLDCGFISDREEAPRAGEIISYQQDVPAFHADMPRYAAAGWRPYLALEQLPRQHNLLYLMKPNRPERRWRLPSEEGLSLSLQFCALLQQAHAAQIVYLDHKLEHVYWDGLHLKVIDFNSSRMLENERRPSPQPYQKDLHNLCVGLLYPLFTGISAQKTALRPQPSSRDAVAARYRDIDQLDFSPEPSLSPSLIELLQRGASQSITSAQNFARDLRRVATLHGWQFPDCSTSAPNSQARQQMRAGLRQLRAGHDNLREARARFRDAMVQDGISPDLEDELRRLLLLLNEMHNSRVLP